MTLSRTGFGPRYFDTLPRIYESCVAKVVGEQNHFDFIHSRDLGQSITDWPKYVDRMFQ